MLGRWYILKERSHQQAHPVLLPKDIASLCDSEDGKNKKFQSCMWENPKDTFPDAPFLHGHSVLHHGATRLQWEHLLKSLTAHCHRKFTGIISHQYKNSVYMLSPVPFTSVSSAVLQMFSGYVLWRDIIPSFLPFACLLACLHGIGWGPST